VRTEEKSAEAVVAKKRGNARGAKGRRNKDKAREATEGKNEKGSEIKGCVNNGRCPASATGRNGGTVASLTSTTPRRNFAELLTESNVRKPDGRGNSAGELQEGPEGSSKQ
jgi:hypothetical protein